ncbi:uncharacterized protein LOC128681763 [Plodia interpunctella]|uniref:uncharacterized protein LOC128681763 n=1 Tax=Plodia interpunctella TaxID=58824 RepID=UPI002368C976|nr:uncharacterized protein LOC128681763 [Plodia interpunctella]
MASSKSPLEKSKMVIPKVFLGKRKITVLTGDSNILRSLKVQQLFKEDVIYESKPGDFLNHDESICIVNRHNLTSNIRRTVLRRADRPNEVLKTSDDIVNLIGQENYDLVFSALCSVFSLELKVRGILALLTARKFVDNFVQTEEICVKKCVDTESQTVQNCMDIFIKQNRRKRVRRQHLTPYVVKDDPPASNGSDNLKKIVIQPDKFQEFQNDDVQTPSDDGGITLPSLSLHDENSNTSIGNMSSLSINTLPLLLENPDALLNNIQSCTETETEQTSRVNYNPMTLTMLDGTLVTIPVKPEDDLHIATSDILNSVTPEHRAKLKLLQAYFDWKYCLERDEDGNLPLHNAVNTGDMELLRRQCLVLKLRNETVDIPVENMTALQMSLYQKNAAATALLLQNGADPLRADAENRTCVHLAAEETSDHLNTIIKHCRDDPLTIIRENDEFSKPGIEGKTKQEQADYIIDRIGRLTDNQGYTPLMVASKLGIYENVATLLDAAPATVNMQMPNTGNTALYLAVSAACIDANNRGNFKKVGENFLKIVGKLVECGADPSIENHTGHSVNILLTEFNIGDLSNVIANKMTAVNCFSGKIDPQRGYENFMLLKDKDGNIKVKNIKVETEKSKPIILENIRVDTKIDNRKLIVSKIDSNVDSKVDDSKYFVGTFRNFIKNETKDVSTVSNIDLTHKSMVVIKDNNKVRRSKVIDTKPAKKMKITGIEVSSPSSSKKK